MFIKTVSTTSGINPIKFDETSGAFYWILNTGSSTVYASTEDSFSAGDDGVVSLGPKESRRLETNNNTIYILGEGQVEIHNQRDGICSFKEAPTYSGGGEIVDAYTKTESDAKYAEKTDVIPYKMGMDFGTCPTPEATINKTVTTLNKSAPGVGAVLAIKFSNAVPDQSRLTVNGVSGFMYYRGNVVPDGIINAGDVVTFMHYINSGFHVFEILSVESDNIVDTYTKEESDNLYASKEIYGDNGIELYSPDGTNTISHGESCTSSGKNSYARGFKCTSSGENSYAGGHGCTSSGKNSYAGGHGCTSSGENSYAGGYDCKAKDAGSFAHGGHVIANKNCEAAFGYYNISNDDTLYSIGDGTSESARHNAFEITKNGGKLHGKDISTAPIKSSSFSATTNAYGSFIWGSANAGKIPLFVDVEGMQGIPFRSVNNYWIYMSHQTVANFGERVANTAVSGTVYYVEN